MKLHFRLVFTFILIFPFFCHAAVKIVSRDQSGETSIIYTEGNQARIETGKKDGYLVLDVAKKTLKLVIHQQRAILDVSDIFSRLSTQDYNRDGEFIDTYISSRGLGPSIAGYETEEYELRANDRPCGTALVSVRAINETGFKKFFNVMNKLGEHMQSKMSGVIAPVQSLSLCDKAEVKLSNKLLDIGFPLRFSNTANHTSNEVIQIDKKAVLPANAFNVPADYKLTTPEQLLSGAMKQLKNLQPEMLKMMKNLPPEARELLRQQIQMKQQ